LYKARITSSLNPNSSPVGEAFSYQITANNNPGSFSAIGLPPGLSLNTGTGVISGTPTASGTFHVTITAIGQVGNAIALLQAIIEPPKLLNLFTLSPQIGDSYAYQVTATSHPISYDATGLPSGLQINKQTGMISGVIMVAGDFIGYPLDSAVKLLWRIRCTPGELRSIRGIIFCLFMEPTRCGRIALQSIRLHQRPRRA
jgi:hypothetical protein